MKSAVILSMAFAAVLIFVNVPVYFNFLVCACSLSFYSVGMRVQHTLDVNKREKKVRCFYFVFFSTFNMLVRLPFSCFSSDFEFVWISLCEPMGTTCIHLLRLLSLWIKLQFKTNGSFALKSKAAHPQPKWIQWKLNRRKIIPT